MADTHINIGGTWKAIDAAYVNIAGTWKTVQNIYVNIGGTWKKTWENVTYTLTGGSNTHTAIDPNDATCAWLIAGATGGLLTKGDVHKANYNSGSPADYVSVHSWISPASGWTTMYWRLTLNSGTISSSSHAVDGTTWHAMTEDSTNIWWTTERTTIGTTSSSVTVEMATDSGGTNIVATGTYTNASTVDV